MTTDVPSFDEWVAYCFELGQSDFERAAAAGEEEYEAIGARQGRYEGLSPAVSTEYLSRLFASPTFLSERYTDKQIARAVWYLFSSTNFLTDVCAPEVEPFAAARCYGLLSNLYLELFDLICCRRGADPDRDYTNRLDLDIAVYMIWDMSRVEGPLHLGQPPHVVEPGYAALEEILSRCRTSTCLISALHGLGHLAMDRSARVQPIIDRFLKRRGVPEWVRHYAVSAREGAVL